MRNYESDLERMYLLLERDHGGCDQEGCNLIDAINDPSKSMEEVVFLWGISGAADNEFNDLYEYWHRDIEALVRDNK